MAIIRQAEAMWQAALERAKEMENEDPVTEAANAIGFVLERAVEEVFDERMNPQEQVDFYQDLLAYVADQLLKVGE